MINDARGGHVSPGVYMEEKDVAMKAKSRGITSLGLVGETLYGPAFQNVEIEDWSEFLDYFGGTSTEKRLLPDGSYAPKYELPYIAKSYLEESRRLNVVRVLGLSGYEAGQGYILKNAKGQAVCLLRKYVEYNSGATQCAAETISSGTSSIKIEKYKPQTSKFSCGTSTDDDTEFSKDKFKLTVDNEVYIISFNPDNNDYIKKALQNSKTVYVEGVYNKFELSDFESSDSKNFDNFDPKDYKSIYRAGSTPWFVSQANVDSGSSISISLKKLFKIYTISDGDSSNYQVKVSIQNLKLKEGYFDVVVRDYNDTDLNPVILEKFSKCSLYEGDASFIGFKIGTIDGRYAAKSKYILVDVNEDENLGGNIPCGFLGYPTFATSAVSANSISYFDTYDEGNYNSKKNYFGIKTEGFKKDEEILENGSAKTVTNTYKFYEDNLNYKGKDFVAADGDDSDATVLTNGFHLDSRLSKGGASISVDNKTGYTFTTVSQSATTKVLTTSPFIGDGMENTIYSDSKLMKFTACFYGGFDGWDINRNMRTNTDEYTSNVYVAKVSGTPYNTFEQGSLDGILNLPSNAITSDYYAYLAGYRVFANPQDVEINILATPGIDWFNNAKLTHEVITLVEDSEFRGGDTLYVMASPENMSPSDLAREFEDSEINSSYACTYFPWITYFDKSNNKYINLTPTKDVVKNMAATDNNYYSWFASAGLKRGKVECLKAAYKTTLADEDVLYENMINPIKSFASDGVKIWGNKTTYRVNSPLNRVNVRRMMLRLKKLVYDASKELIFEQYDETLENQFKSIVEPILNDIKTKRGIYDAKLIVESTPEMKDEHLLAAKIMVKPTPALEYISLSFVVYPESVEFDEA